MKKLFFIICCILISKTCWANMSSPYIDGTTLSEVLTSKDVNILGEKMHVTINKHLLAKYEIEYHIKTDTSGKQIPLLFYTYNYEEGFDVSIDNKKIKVLDIPPINKNPRENPFNRFPRSIDSIIIKRQDLTSSFDTTYRTEYGGFDSENLKYFEVDLSKGEHIIKVEYFAAPTISRSSFVNLYIYKYLLSPAEDWKSFGTLEITINFPTIDGKFSTNIGKPTEGNLKSTAYWKFNKLPSDNFEIYYTPRVNFIAQILIFIEPFGLTLLFCFLLIKLHYNIIKKHREANPLIKYSKHVILGSIINPLLILIFYVYSFDFIDFVIGEEASDHHGYTFLVMLLYPFILPIYWISMWLVDRYIKKRMKKND